MTLKDPRRSFRLIWPIFFRAQIRWNMQASCPLRLFRRDHEFPPNNCAITPSMTNANTSLCQLRKLLLRSQGTNTSNQKFRILEVSVYISPEVTKWATSLLRLPARPNFLIEHDEVPPNYIAELPSNQSDNRRFCFRLQTDLEFGINYVPKRRRKS